MRELTAKTGANGEFDTTTSQASVLSFVLTNAGLMADLGLSGTRFVRSDT